MKEEDPAIAKATADLAEILQLYATPEAAKRAGYNLFGNTFKLESWGENRSAVATIIINSHPTLIEAGG